MKVPESFRMESRRASLVALFVVVTVITSAVQICLPGVGAENGKTAAGQMPCGQQSHHDSFPVSDFHVSGFPQVCCKSVEPLVLTKLHSLSAPVRDVLHWMTPAVLAATTLDPTVHLTATTSPTPPHSLPGGNPPRYVVHRSFLI